MEEILYDGWGITPERIVTLQENVWRVDSGPERFALKQSLLKEKNLHFICTAEDSLFRHGFHDYALLLPPQNGQFYYAENNNFFTLHRWIDGEKCDFDNIGHLYNAAETLFSFHLRSREKSLKNLASSRFVCFDRYQQLAERGNELQRFYELASLSPQTYFTKLYRAYYGGFLEKTRRAQKALLCSEYPRLAKEAAGVGAFIHYDVAARNFIIQKEKALLIDFDYCCCDLPLTDLMRLIKRSLKSGAYHEAKIDAILRGYQQYRRLTRAEGEVLYALLLFPQKYWRISHRYFYEQKTNEEDYYIKKMENAVKELEKEDCWLNLLKERLEE